MAGFHSFFYGEYSIVWNGNFILSPSDGLLVWFPAYTLSRFSNGQLFDPMDHSLPGSPVHGILQAGILKWVAMPSSWGSSWCRDWTCISYVSCIGRRVFATSSTWEALLKIDIVFVFPVFLFCFFFLPNCPENLEFNAELNKIVRGDIPVLFLILKWKHPVFHCKH